MRYLMVALLVVVMFLIAFFAGEQIGIQKGKSQALKTNPVSEELEQTCFSLWLGQQAKKAWEKENGKK